MKENDHKSQESENSEKPIFVGDGIKNLDIMGEKFKFHYTKQVGRYQTRLGGFISILVIALSFAALVFVSSQYFDTTSPIVTTSRELSTETQSFNVYGKDLFSGTAIGFRNVFQTTMANLVTMKGEIFQKTINTQSNSTKIQKIKTFNFIPCPQITEDPSLINLVKKIVEGANLNIFLRPHFKEVDNNVTLSYDPQTLSSTYLTVRVYPCSLPNRNECYPIVTGYDLRMTTGENSNLIQPSNFKNPVAFRWIPSSSIVDITRTKSFRYVLRQNKIIDDRHFLKNPETKAEYGLFKLLSTESWERDMTDQYCTTAMIDADECTAYMEFIHEMDSEVVITRRRYKKIPALLGEFGGMLKLLTTAFVILSFYYTKAIKSFLFNQVFGVEKSKASKIIKRATKNLDLPNLRETENHGLEVPLAKLSHRKKKKGLIDQKKPNSRKSIEVDRKKSFDEAIKTITDVVGLAQKMNLVDLLKGASLSKHHQILLPIVLLNAKLCDDQNRGPSGPGELVKPKNDEKVDNYLPKNKDIGANKKSSMVPSRGKKTEEFSADLKTYRAIKPLHPRNHLEGMFNQQILRYLSPIYEAEERDHSRNT